LKLLFIHLNNLQYIYINPEAADFIYEELGFADASPISHSEFLSWRKSHIARCRAGNMIIEVVSANPNSC